ncbi:MAG: hypothetical protein ACLTR6_12690 [Clostridium fessum]
MREDLTGRRYGRLTVCREIKQAEKAAAITGCAGATAGKKNRGGVPSEKQGIRKCCGCYRKELPSSRRIDLTGRQFGRLKVLEEADNSNRTGEYWKCVCSCGRLIERVQRKPVRGKTKSCGSACRREYTEGKHEKAIHFVGGTCLERIANQKNTANNTSGYRGVYQRENSRWRASDRLSGKSVQPWNPFVEPLRTRWQAKAEKAEEELCEPFLREHGVKAVHARREVFKSA